MPVPGLILAWCKNDPMPYSVGINKAGVFCTATGKTPGQRRRRPSFEKFPKFAGFQGANGPASGHIPGGVIFAPSRGQKPILGLTVYFQVV